MHSSPSQLTSTAGRNRSGSDEKSTVAPSLRCSSQLLLKWMGPQGHTPSGTTTRPPPASLQACIARLNASVLAVVQFSSVSVPCFFAP